MTRGAGPGAAEVAALVEWVGQHLNPPAWHSAAACRNVGSDIFFVGQGRSPKEAKAICAVCPALSECREWALRQKELQGIWAGMTGPELAAERKRRRAAAQSALVV
ncbi:MAG: WhiB family transcriptional regulator [Acidimicrobiia bacterium]